MVKYDEESIRRQMWKLEMPEVWTPVDLDDPALPVVERPPGVEVEEVAKQAPDPPAERPGVGRTRRRSRDGNAQIRP